MRPDRSLCALRVFISSTYEDLKPYVHAAEDVLREQHVDVDQFKHWESTGRPSVPECRERVAACDALVLLVGGTYGWIPRVEEGGDGRTSITRRYAPGARARGGRRQGRRWHPLRRGADGDPAAQ